MVVTSAELTCCMLHTINIFAAGSIDPQNWMHTKIDTDRFFRDRSIR
jgi:hypothetical protein